MGLEYEQMAGARASGIGEAVSSMEGDIDLIHYNPAGIAALKRSNAGFNYMMGFSDIYFTSVMYGHPFPFGVIGGSYSYLNGGSLEISEGQFLNAQSDIVVTLSFATHMLKELSFGANVKFLSSTLVQLVSAQSWAFDIGFLYRIPKGINLSLVLQNVGTPLQYYIKPEQLPTNARAGISYCFDVTNSMFLNTSFELKYYVNENEFLPSIGAEFGCGKELVLRAGYVFNSTRGVTMGAGFNLMNYKIDYAFEFANNISTFGNHRIGFSVGF